ncbi:hypothetical protein ACFC6L_32935 [Kitasatospora phosalacinea]|uniref:hypothetical protein n=1 Tax=Kitasatospora phosalacinea TaxID=2065 RepID=UPI0035DEBFFC
MGENSALTHALEVAQQQLAEAEEELVVVRDRVRQLRSVVFSLKSLLEPGDAHRDALHLLTALSLKQHRDSDSDQKPPRPEPTALREQTARRRSGTTSLERAVQVLADAGRPMQMAEIRDEWARRGWVNENWKAPYSAINMVYQRALKAGLVGRMNDRSWVLPMAIQDQLSLEEGHSNDTNN